jgi:hypothetical protein
MSDSKTSSKLVLDLSLVTARGADTKAKDLKLVGAGITAISAEMSKFTVLGRLDLSENKLKNVTGTHLLRSHHHHLWLTHCLCMCVWMLC